jgi:hypothetical protein
MGQDPDNSRLAKIERRLNILIGVAVVQAVLLAIIAVSYFVPSTFTLITCCILVGAFVVVFRKQIPGWLGKFSRYFFTKIRDMQEPDSVKDLK